MNWGSVSLIFCSTEMASLPSGGAQSLHTMVRPLFEAGVWRSEEDNYDELQEEYNESDQIDFDTMSRQFSAMEDPSEFRGDAISDIQWGLGKVGTLIKIVSAVLTLLGDGDTTVDRYETCNNMTISLSIYKSFN